MKLKRVCANNIKKGQECSLWPDKPLHMVCVDPAARVFEERDGNFLIRSTYPPHYVMYVDDVGVWTNIKKFLCTGDY